MLQPAIVDGTPTKAIASKKPSPSVARVNGVELYYVDRGAGAPIVFVHGGLVDYREWSAVADAMPDEYRMVTYSRRHSFPNRNPSPRPDHAMLRDVEDLAALIEELKLGPVHVAGVSYGAFVSLMLALHRPDLVRSVIAAEPPLLHWLPDIDGGREVYDHFHRTVMTSSAAAFATGDSEGALRAALEYFVGPDGINVIPPEVRDMLMANIEDWRAITTAPDALPHVTREQLAAISVPVLLISGAETANMHQLIDPEIARVIPTASRIIIVGGTHDMCSEKPAECAAAINQFIAGQVH